MLVVWLSAKQILGTQSMVHFLFEEVNKLTVVTKLIFTPQTTRRKVVPDTCQEPEQLMMFV